MPPVLEPQKDGYDRNLTPMFRPRGERQGTESVQKFPAWHPWVSAVSLWNRDPLVETRMADPDRDDLATLLEAVERGDKGAGEQLFIRVYDELRRLAHREISGERPGQTLQTTALVHEAYFRLCGDKEARWENRRHFFGAAARAMRRILIDRARRKKAEIHGGGLARVPLENNIPFSERPFDLIALDEALERLAAIRPRHAEVVHHRYFLGLTVAETAEILGISPRTVDTDWQFAKSWLRREMTSGSGQSPEGQP
jgi:RNA polymerase sigma factor (TIGR02999 family)